MAQVVKGIFVRGNEIQAVLTDGATGKMVRSNNFGVKWYDATGEPNDLTDIAFNTKDKENTFIVSGDELYYNTGFSAQVPQYTAGASLTGSGIVAEADLEYPIALIGTSSKLYKTIDWGQTVVALKDISVTDIAIGSLVQAISGMMNLLVYAVGDGTVWVGGIRVDSYPFSGNYTYGTTISLEAVPSPGYGWQEWQGDVENPDSASTVVIMDANQNITAVFDLDLKIHETFNRIKDLGPVSGFTFVHFEAWSS